MKNLVLPTLFSLCCIASAGAADNELSLAKKALSGDYQAQRNLAYGYVHGWGKNGDVDFIPQDTIRACAWRKVILLANQKTADSSDYVNESVDCQKVAAVDNHDVWKLVWTIINSLPH